MTPPSFRYEHDRYLVEDVPLAELAERYGTPLYVYSRAELVGRARALREAVAALGGEALICYAVKANGQLALLRLLQQEGLGVDVTSGGELFLALNAGISSDRIIYSGVGKSAREIHEALDAGIRALHIESEAEYRRVAAIATLRRQSARLSVRVNPDIAADTHQHISTGRSLHKFGVPPELAIRLLRQAAAHPWLEPAGVAAHIGSQIRDLAPFGQMAAFLVGLADELRSAGVALASIDVGGGLGIDYDGQGAPALAAWVETVGRPVIAAGYSLTLEPGRSLVGPAGVLLTRVEYVKEQGGKRFVVIDAGMSDLIRPTLYQAHHAILPLRRAAGPLTPADVVGPICETGDFLAKEREMPAVQSGDLLAVTDAGAYGFAMSSNYNGRLRPAEVLVSGRWSEVIRRRQSYGDLLM